MTKSEIRSTLSHLLEYKSHLLEEVLPNGWNIQGGFLYKNNVLNSVCLTDVDNDFYCSLACNVAEWLDLNKYTTSTTTDDEGVFVVTTTSPNELVAHESRNSIRAHTYLELFEMVNTRLD